MKIGYKPTTLLFVFWMALPSPIQAQTSDETDMSRYQVVEEGTGFPMFYELADQEDMARTTFESGDCDEALPLILKYSIGANKMANIIKQGVAPYYDASRDDKADIMRKNRTRFEQLVKAENTSNALIYKRNEFWVMEAECLLKIGDREAAINKLYRVLDKTSGSREGYIWDKARDLLWKTVGYTETK